MIKRQIDFVESIEEIGIEVWNNLAGTDNPFTRYEFLHALESSGSTTAATGWQPFHVLITEKTDTETEIYDQPIAVMPLYLKSNSWGEYVFDWSWAEAYARHGIDYYPKFVTSIPFTPSCGNRILTQEGIDLYFGSAIYICKDKGKGRVFECFVLARSVSSGGRA